MTTLDKLIAEELSGSAPEPEATDDAILLAELAELLGADLVALLPFLTVVGTPDNVIASFVHAGYDYSLHVISLGIVLTRVDPPREENQRRPRPYAVFYERAFQAAISPRAWFLRALDKLTVAALPAE